MSDKVKILDTKQIQQKINRLAYQVYENNFLEKELLIDKRFFIISSYKKPKNPVSQLIYCV